MYNDDIWLCELNGDMSIKSCLLLQRSSMTRFFSSRNEGAKGGQNFIVGPSLEDVVEPMGGGVLTY